jgi:hypothetical protein
MKSPLHLATVVTLALALGAGCGLRQRVDRSDLDSIPPEDKLSLFEAENEVLIAKDEIAAARNDKEDAETALDRAQDESSTLSRRASGEKDPKVASLLRQWGAQKVTWRKAEIDLCEAREDAARSELMAARARYERAKAVIMKERAPRRATGISVKDFDSQVKSYESDARDDQKDLDKVRKQRDERRKAYDVVSRQLQAISGGAYGGPWAD